VKLFLYRAGHRRFAASVLAGLAVAALVGCAAPSPTTVAFDAAAEHAELMRRAREYWALIAVNDKVKAWPYETRSRDPQWTVQAYVQRGGILYHGVDVKGVKSMNSERAEIVLDVDYSVPLARIKRQKVEMIDRWRRIDGVWYHIQPRSSVTHQAEEVEK
jgi:hypothetical protein